MTSKKASRRLWSLCLVLLSLLTAAGLVACGSSSEADSGAVMPTIVGVKPIDAGLQVSYSAPGADGGEWPVLRVSVRKADGFIPPTSQYARPVEEDGTVLVPIEVKPNEDLVAYGSVFYEDGRRVHLPEKHFRP